MATQNSNSISITGGSITGITDITLADGGTNASLFASAGAVAYSTASALALSGVGTSGQVLTSAGTSAPTWTAQSSLSVGTATNATQLGGVAAASYLKTTAGVTISAGFNVTAYSIPSAPITPDPLLGNYQYYTSTSAPTINAPTTDCAIDILFTNGASAGTPAFVGYTVGSVVGSPYATTLNYRFILSIRRIASVSTYSWYALQ